MEHVATVPSVQGYRRLLCMVLVALLIAVLLACSSLKIPQNVPSYVGVLLQIVAPKSPIKIHQDD